MGKWRDWTDDRIEYLNTERRKLSERIGWWAKHTTDLFEAHRRRITALEKRLAELEEKHRITFTVAAAEPEEECMAPFMYTCQKCGEKVGSFVGYYVGGVGNVCEQCYAVAQQPKEQPHNCYTCGANCCWSDADNIPPAVLSMLANSCRYWEARP